MKMASHELALPMTGHGLEEGEQQAALLKRAQAGDLAALEQIIIEHERRVFLTALRLLGSREDAQDATQEVFLRLHKHLGRFDATRDFRPWLYQVTINVCRDVHRQRRKTTMLPLGGLEEFAGDAADPQAAITQAERKKVVTQCLQSLSEKERAALVLRDIEGLPTKEVARILGSREATVRVQVAAARLKIRKLTERLLRKRV